MKSKNLLTQISDLEIALNNFSFEELSTKEASRLKRSFDRFKAELETKIWGDNPTPPEPDEKTAKKGESHLIAKVSHEVRTPLNGIMGFADLLKESDLKPAQEEQVNAILSASRSLLEIINELLEYSKLEAGSEDFKVVSFNFHNLIAEVTYLCETLIVDKKITLEVKTDPNIPDFLLGDPSKLTQVLLNLLGNAIKFSDKGRVTLEASLRKIHKGKAHLQFGITDTGIGISGEDLDHIFDAFRQAGQHTFSKYGGAGLGLSIVKQIVDRMDGTISVQSKVDEGTRFDMALAFEVGQEETPKKINTEKIPEKDVRTLNVLVFEDNPLNQWLIEKRLRNWGCKYFVTEHAVEGLKVLEKENIHVVFMDLHMPVIDGYEITRRIRASEDPRISGVPVIALTADFSVHDREKAEADGIDDFILKPYTPEELLDKLVEYGFPESGRPASPEIKKTEENKINGLDNHLQIDLTGMLEDCMGEVDMLEELIALFKGNILEFIGRAKLHLKNHDKEQLRFAAHKMKSGLAMIQADNLLILVRQIQDHCQHDPDFDRMQFLYDRFVKEYPMVEFAVDRELTRLKKEND